MVIKMTKQEIQPLLGKFVQAVFTLKSKKFNVITYFDLYGHVIRVEDKNILFKDNYNHEYLVPNVRVKSLVSSGRRRKEAEYIRQLEKDSKKQLVIMDKAKKKLESIDEQLTVVNYDKL
jgi:hypothetical protein